MRKLVTLAAVAVSLLGVSLQASAAVTTTTVGGTQGRAEQTCISVFALFFPQDCTVSGWADLGLAFADTQQGPLQSGGFYAPGTNPTVATGSNPGDGKANLIYLGGSSISINDSGTAGDASDDLISFSLVLAGGVRNTSTSGGSINEGWSSITQTLVDYAVDSTSANGFGGTDYVIGSAGMMLDICTADLAGQPGTGGCFGNSEYGSALSGDPLVDVNVWSRLGGGPPGVWSPGYPLPSNVNYGGAGVNNNVGATTTATIAGYTCLDTGGLDPDCAPIDGIGEDGFALTYGNSGGQWDNLIMTISTDAAGNVVEAKGFYVQMYDIILGGFNSWVGGSFELSAAAAVPVPAAVWLFGSALGLLGWMRRRTVA